MKKTIIVTFLLTILVSTTLFADGVMPAGSGTENDPYLIATLNNLLYLSTNDDLWVEDIYFSQATDIDAADTQTWNDGAGFIRIGYYPNYFYGNYDGNGYTISNLYIYRPNTDDIGLFGSTFGATINNLGMVDGDITGSVNVGGLVGRTCNSTISNSYSTGCVNGADRVGGLVGKNYSSSEVSNSYSTGSVSGADRVGGLVGHNFINSEVSNSYSTGCVNGADCVGGLVGNNNYASCEVSNSHYDYETVTINDDHIITLGALPSNMFTAWISNGLSLQIDDYISSDGNDYLINSFDDFEKLLAFAEYSDYSFKLTADLDLSTEPNFYIPFLMASFDGNGYTISNLYINQPDTYYIGLFGRTLGATITNLVVVDGDIIGDRYVGGLVGQIFYSTINKSYSTGSVSGSSSYIGGLVGRTYNSTISNSYSTGSVSGSHSVGGLVGYNKGDISNSYCTGSVIGSSSYIGGLVGLNSSYTINNSYSTGSVIGSTAYVGGLVGKNCYLSTISNSYSTGSVSGSRSVGGLVGYNNGPISNSFWDTQTSGQTNSDGGTGKTTAEMQTLSTFTDAGWDFAGETDNGTEDHWFMPENSYPELSWELLNDAPVIDDFQPEDELEISEEGEVQFSVTASDADNENLNYTWYFDNAEMDETTAS
ncbi:MAG: GLUG motif-containing protein, partial [Candidatus Cloacimonadota bacterium]|nr:GLUG motif-containing protein [Candidatus Cloacimonadota bacterium]